MKAAVAAPHQKRPHLETLKIHSLCVSLQMLAVDRSWNSRSPIRYQELNSSNFLTLHTDVTYYSGEEGVKFLYSLADHYSG